MKIFYEPLFDESLRRIRLADANSVPTPVASGMRIELDESRKSFTGPYSESVGVLLYLSNTVRLDTSFAIGKLARCCAGLKKLY